MVYELKPKTNIKQKGIVFKTKEKIVSVLNGLFEDECINVMTIETYSLVDLQSFNKNIISELNIDLVIESKDVFLEKEVINQMLQYDLTEDRVYGKFTNFSMEDFINKEKLSSFQNEISLNVSTGKKIVIVGPGASFINKGDATIYIDLTRLEIQNRYKSGKYSNWMADNKGEDTLRMIKRGYFIEWPMFDKLKNSLLPHIDYWIEAESLDNFKMIDSKTYFSALKEVAHKPFSLVPFVEPGIWGGHWMQEHLVFSKDKHNLAWNFNGVPEENSLMLDFNGDNFEIPGSNLMFLFGEEVLGERVFGRFGNSFPIRFNFLDTVGGQNLSLQVHPKVDYVQNNFGAHYTQDESYYILHAEDNSTIYLGVKNGTEKSELVEALEKAATGATVFEDEKYIYQQPVFKHDHFSIPAGTIHSSGKDTVVLEVSSTPNRFTFKLWDWQRKDLDGLPRPVHLNHGIPNIDIRRDEDWVKANLVNQVKRINSGKGWYEEVTGLHKSEFIETRRHTFSEPVLHENHGSVNVLNLIEGDEATIVSVDGVFEPFVVHYAQTVIIPETIKAYIIKPSGSSKGKTLKTIKAFVR